MATFSDEHVVLDTNVLVYATNSAAPQHAAARRLHDRALAGDVPVCLTTQILFEYFAVVTHEGQLTRLVSPADALADLDALRSAFPLLSVPPDLDGRVVDLLRRTGFSGRNVFDVQLAATMLANGVHRIATYDSRFAKIPGIAVVQP
jgi:toxin-antitoxin system PIN domain toxin